MPDTNGVAITPLREGTPLPANLSTESEAYS